MKTLTSVDELHVKLGNAGLVIFDCRFSLGDATAGASAWAESHIPGAHYVSLDEHLSAAWEPGKTGRHPLPDREAFAATLGGFGVTPQDEVVVYDDAAGAFAARLWWMLRWLGHADVAVLDGGFKAWLDAGHPVTADVPERTPATFPVRAPLTRVVSAAEVATRRQLLLDARDANRFRGENETIDPVAGHIPGAVNAPFMENLAEGPRLKTADSLRERFTRLGVASGDDTICYCGSGVTAAHNILAMRHAGFEEPALYPGSWSEWITDPTRPVSTDSD